MQGVERRLFGLTSAFVGVFCLWALIDLTSLSEAITAGFAWSTQWFGYVWQVGLLLTFVLSLTVAVAPASTRTMGGLSQPEFGWFEWSSMILCTLLAGGGVFWAAGEPIAHFVSPPSYFEATEDVHRLAVQALAQSYLHWGFLAWSILGSLTTIVLMKLHYEDGHPLAPRTLLVPVFGESIVSNWLGVVVDACCIIAVVAGTVGPIGFLGLQVGYGLEALFNVPNTVWTQSGVVFGLMALYTMSALTGVSKGIQILSRINIGLGGLLLLYMLTVGPTSFIVRSFGEGLVLYGENLFSMAMFRGDTGWLGWWTVFFWGWFLGYGPMMAIFIARISRGRSIRSIIVMISIVAPLVTNAWFTIIGGTGLGLELTEPGIVSTAFEGFNLPAVLLAITQSLPMGFLISVLFLALTTIFVATTGDSMTYVVSMSMSKTDEPPSWLRVFWGVAMGLTAIILLSVGETGVQSLQSFIVITAAPVFFVILPSLWIVPKWVLEWSKKL